MSLPNGGEMNLSRVPEHKYQRTMAAGPCQPTSYDSFLENSKMSSVGFEKFE
jgi:hypothetical protein